MPFSFCLVPVCVVGGRMKLWMGDCVSWNFSSPDLPMKKQSRLVQQWQKGWKRLVFIPIPKKSNAKECSDYHTIALISPASKVMLKILQELPDVQVGFRKGKRQRNQRSNCQHLLNHRKSKRIPENIYFCIIDFAKAFDCVDHNTLWTILKEMGISDHLTCLLRNLYAGQKATINQTCNNGLIPNWGRNMSRLYIVTLLI